MPSLFVSYWLKRPDMAISDAQHARFQALQPAKDGYITVESAPMWHYLDWLTRTTYVVFHGSNASDISWLTPRRPQDNSPDSFSKQCAVFAAGDPLWAIFHAILRRPQPNLRVLSAAFQIVRTDGSLADMQYFFSITKEVLAGKPWCDGTVYILPKGTFRQMPAYDMQGHQILEPHWASPVAVRPRLRVAVSPVDFPFLTEVRGHDNEYISTMSRCEPYGFPWLMDDERRKHG